ncbi:biotin/lipoate A/B protein ligase family protein [Geomicrobium sp. JCM 19038]|uniref:lipoate--protein ligase family protein n=1 Tax=Geomicrobium sp. JCM 19038 TaxID=1460635 RepID=UPI00045F36DB|nr:biotin/lipoate A/B protein ligase family protein [Geomicrobium sp. JCM 19038]GAK06516.1 lipoate-protein ligase A [Geomicrobium sp. JCM 19038]
MQKETWLFLESGACSPSYNMALDEKLLQWHSEGKIPPVIRFYEWNPASLSLGYFQKIHKEINITAVEEHELGIVRRPTGGRAVLHDKELTYSVIVNEDHPKMPETVTEAYRVISEGLLEGFRQLGLEANLSIPKTKEDTDALKNPTSAVCFDAPSWYELVVEGKKIAGSAQTRQKGVILQHGAIVLAFDVDQLFSVFKFKDDRMREQMQKRFLQKAVSIQDLTSTDVTIPQLREAFKVGFEQGLDVHLEPMTLTEEQKQEVESLAIERYQSDDWTYRR